MRHRPSLARPSRFPLAPAAQLLVGAVLLSSCASSGALRHYSPGPFDGEAIEAAAPRPQDDDSEGYAKRGFFVGGLGIYTTLSDSDFDGNSTITEPSGVTLALPELDPGLGWGVTVGYRFRRNSLQYTYTESMHDDEFLGGSEEDEFKTYSLDFKHYWNVDSRLQPYVLLGLTVSRLIVEGGATDGVNLGDGVFQGLGGNIGGGAALYLTPQLSLFGELLYRVIEVDRARGLGVNRDIMGHLDGSGFALRGGLSFTF